MARAKKDPAPARPKYTVVRDTREKPDKGWRFEESETCGGTVVDTLRTGDYSLRGYEHVVAVERKGSASEFVGNLTHKEKWAAFKEELARLDAFESPRVVLEFTLEDLARYPEGSGLPWAVRRRIKVSPQFFLKRLIEIELNFKAKVVFAGRAGREYVSSLFKRVVEKWPQPPPPACSVRPPA